MEQETTAIPIAKPAGRPPTGAELRKPQVVFARPSEWAVWKAEAARVDLSMSALVCNLLRGFMATRAREVGEK